jgi:hypothetical protein
MVFVLVGCLERPVRRSLRARLNKANTRRNF